jgi:hypothetical protein
MYEDPACRQVGTEAFFPPDTPTSYAHPLSKAQVKLIEQAKQVCKGCPVLNQCRRDTLGETHGVWGGLDQHQRHLIRKALPKAAENWPRTRRLAWGRIIHSLRPVEADGYMLWSRVTRMTGIGRSLGMALRGEYLAWLESQSGPSRQSEHKVTPVWPAKRSSLDAWVWHENRAKPAHYVAHSPDGTRVLVKLQLSSCHTVAWMSAGLVRITGTAPVQIREIRTKEPVNDHIRAA